MPQFLFRKAEHLLKQTDIDRLFSKGSHSITAFPLKAVWCEVNSCDFPAQILLSVSKKRLHHAVDRNRAKRQIREAYRLQKPAFWDNLTQQARHLHIAFVWLSETNQPTQAIQHSMERLLRNMIQAGQPKAPQT